MPAGTLEFGQFRLIQGYLLTYGVAALLLSFVVLPAVVACVTPFGYIQIVRAARNPLITAFVIGNTFVVLPMMIEAIREMQLQKDGSAGGDQAADPEYLLPMAYSIPRFGTSGRADLFAICRLVLWRFDRFRTISLVDHYRLHRFVCQTVDYHPVSAGIGGTAGRYFQPCFLLRASSRRDLVI